MGPYQIGADLYEKAISQIQALDSGSVMYNALDCGFRPDGACNCIHAVTDIDVAQGVLLTGTRFGVEASAMVVSHLNRWVVNPQNKHPEINYRLNLAKYSLTQMDR